MKRTPPKRCLICNKFLKVGQKSERFKYCTLCGVKKRHKERIKKLIKEHKCIDCQKKIYLRTIQQDGQNSKKIEKYPLRCPLCTTKNKRGLKNKKLRKQRKFSVSHSAKSNKIRREQLKREGKCIECKSRVNPVITQFSGPTKTKEIKYPVRCYKCRLKMKKYRDKLKLKRLEEKDE